MKLKPIFNKFRSVSGLFFLSFLLMGAVIIIKFNRLPPQAPLFYSLAEGDDQVVDILFLSIVPSCVILLLGLNHVIYSRLFSQDAFIKKVLDYFNIAVILFFTYIFIRIIVLIS